MIRPMFGSVATIVLVFAAGCSDHTAAHQAVFGSEAAAAVVRNATTVQAYRLAAPSFFQQTLDRYEMAAGPVPVPANLADQLKRLLLDPESYDFTNAKSCNPAHEVRIEFVHGDRRIDVLLCFECGILTVYDDGQYAGGEEFHRVNAQLVAIVKQLFPQEQLIQSLQ